MDRPPSNPPKIEIEPGLSPPRLRLAGRPAAPVEPSGTAVDGPSSEDLLKEARGILMALKVDRSRIEARLAEQGREDPIGVVRGSSALDEAIVECQEVIERLDRLVHATKSAE